MSDRSARTRREQLRRQWAKDKEAFAQEWFAGDLDAAEELLDSLPYSEIPGWHSAQYVMETVTKLLQKKG